MSNQSLSRRARRERIERRARPSEPAAHLVLVPSAPVASAPDLPADTPEAFCARMKAARERRGLTLGAIAESTKISPGLLAALERGNLSRWPGGIYRRAFFASYAEAIGLRVEPAVVEFLRLFPDEETAAALPAPPPRVPSTTDAGRLALAGRPQPSAAQVRAASAEAAIVLLVAAAAEVIIGGGEGAAALVVLATWYGRPALTQLLRHARRLVARGRMPS
jgi:transcriptional regulator with XRE-family HTH domain